MSGVSWYIKKPFTIAGEGFGSLKSLRSQDEVRNAVKVRARRLVEYFQRNDEESTLAASRVLRLVEAQKEQTRADSNVVSGQDSS
ncbi:MAG: hypothetical protein A2294_03565 [Candidatus Magasanikbacteria bacterium RIFOXYB2_FULL_38_10]|nr:MAG: hypothetical protein A2294_03565 [Candidatus Magasanikbacteria bacterium RIFOXYB2_FULL_38_10]